MRWPADWTGPPGSPMAFETQFGWVLAGEVDTSMVCENHVTSHHVTINSGDDILRQFWEVEHLPSSESCLFIEEKSVVKHFKANHFRESDGTFVVPLPRKHDTKPLGRKLFVVSYRWNVHSTSKISSAKWMP